MIGRSHRFHGYGSLRAVYRSGQTVRGPKLSLKYTKRQAGKPYRLAVVVSRKVSPSAVTRNRIRRRIYEVVRQAEPQLIAGQDFIFTVFAGQLAELPADKLKASIEELLVKTKIS